MVLLQVLNGTAAGTEFQARRFPLRVGRAPDADFGLEADGVWERHLTIELDPATGFVARVRPETVALVNGHPMTGAVLRAGDLIELGAARLRFSLGPTRLRNYRFREVLTWIAVAALCLAQVALIYVLGE